MCLQGPKMRRCISRNLRKYSAAGHFIIQALIRPRLPLTGKNGDVLCKNHWDNGAHTVPLHEDP